MPLAREHAGGFPLRVPFLPRPVSLYTKAIACQNRESVEFDLHLFSFLHGIGATPLFTIGVSYIDESVGPALSSFYLGIFYAFGVFGPALGFLASRLRD